MKTASHDPKIIPLHPRIQVDTDAVREESPPGTGLYETLTYIDHLLDEHFGS